MTAKPPKEKEGSMLDWLFKKAPERFQEGLNRLEKLLQVARGRVDIKSRLNLLLDPDKPQTSTYLNRAQVQFVTAAHFTGRAFEVFKPLSEYATELELSLISLDGRGVDSSVKLTAALEAMKILEHTGLPTKKGETD